MPLSQDKSEARDATALALELNEPETMVEGLRRLCAKWLEAGDMAPSERDRWQAAINALASVANELEATQAPQTRQVDATTPQADKPVDC